MIASRVRVYYSATSYIHLPIDSTIQTSQYILKNIDGLNDAQLDVSIASNALGNSTFQGRSYINKELVLTVGLKPNFAIGQTSESLRQQIYNLLSPSFGISNLIEFRDSSNVLLRSIRGYVKRIVANPFTKDPEVQITIPCMSSFLEAPSYTVPSPGTIGKNPISITNLGNAPTGIFIKFAFTAQTTTFTLRNDDYSQDLSISYLINAGDTLSFWTQPGQRKIELFDGTTVKSMVPYLVSNKQWLTLFSGVTKYYPNTTNFNLTEVTYIPKYWGM